MSLGLGVNHQSTNSATDISQLINQLFSQSTSGASSGTSAGTTSGTQSGETARVLSPEQQAAQGNIGKVISSLMTNPQAFLAPAQNQARNNVNQNYSGLADSLRQQFMSGEGGSGKYGTAALRGDLARRGALSDVDSTFASSAAMLPITAAGLSQNLLNTNLGTKSTGVEGTTSSGTSSQTGTSTTSGSSSQDTTGKSNTKGSSTGVQGGFSI